MSEVEKLQLEAEEAIRYASVVFKAAKAMEAKEGSNSYSTLSLYKEAATADRKAAMAIAALLAAIKD